MGKIINNNNNNQIKPYCEAYFYLDLLCVALACSVNSD